MDSKPKTSLDTKLEKRADQRHAVESWVAHRRAGDYLFLSPVLDVSMGGIFLQGVLYDRALPEIVEIDLYCPNGLNIKSLKACYQYESLQKSLNPKNWPLSEGERLGSAFRWLNLREDQKEDLQEALHCGENLYFL